MRTIAAIVSLAIGLAVLNGCSASAPPQTQQDVKNFQGGPMPPDFQKQFEERQKENQNKIGQSIQRK
ncbi:MAG TPA: hypothetical protein VMI31_17770 [Fimbriimonadaceae bacterium]|nr:hypothetical protein [Fimbriimonadaceae bacterium]